VQLVTDKGKEFIATVCQDLWNKLNIVHITTSAQHSQANAQAEVANKTIARYLASYVDETTLDWEQFISPMMFSYNTSYHRSIKTSPFFLTFGVHPNLPNQLRMPQYGSDLPTEILLRLQLIRNIARKNAQDASEEYKNSHDNKSENRDFYIGQLFTYTDNCVR